MCHFRFSDIKTLYKTSQHFTVEINSFQPPCSWRRNKSVKSFMSFSELCTQNLPTKAFQTEQKKSLDEAHLSLYRTACLLTTYFATAAERPPSLLIDEHMTHLWNRSQHWLIATNKTWPPIWYINRGCCLSVQLCASSSNVSWQFYGMLINEADISHLLKCDWSHFYYSFDQ